MARAKSRVRSGWRLPDDALFIGAYSHPANADDFLSDLDDVLARLPADTSTATSAG